MDDFTDAVLSVQLTDITQAERWFELVCRAYGESVSAGEDSWDGFRERLSGGAAEEGFSAEAETWTEYLAATTSAPLDVVANMSAQGEGRLVELYAAEMAAVQAYGEPALADGQVADDPAAWNSYLTTNGSFWDGREAGWQEFRDWFLYYAAEAGVQQSAEIFIDDVEAQQDKVDAFRQYGITVPAQPSSADSAGSAEAAESAEAVDPSSFPKLSEGDTGEWVEYLDNRLSSHGFQPGEGSIAAVFNEVMTTRVKAFQQTSGLAATGVVSQETWETLLLEKPQEPEAPDPGKAAEEVLLDPKEFPLTYEIATLTDEEALSAFFGRHGIDLDAIMEYREAVESNLSDISEGGSAL